jgi:hypothetical protein
MPVPVTLPLGPYFGSRCGSFNRTAGGGRSGLAVIEVKPLRCKSVRVCHPDDRARVCSGTPHRAYEGSRLIDRSQRTETQSQRHSAFARSRSGYCRACDLFRRFYRGVFQRTWVSSFRRPSTLKTGDLPRRFLRPSMGAAGCASKLRRASTVQFGTPPAVAHPLNSPSTPPALRQASDAQCTEHGAQRPTGLVVGRDILPLRRHLA